VKNRFCASICLLGLCLLPVRPCVAAGPGTLPGYRIGVIDLTRVYRDYTRTKIGQEKLAARFREYDAERKKLTQELTEMRDEVNVMRREVVRGELATAEREERQREIEEKMLAVVRFRNDIGELEKTRNAQLEGQARRLRSRIIERIRDAVTSYAEKNEIYLIVESSARGVGNVEIVVYKSARLDITDAVLEILNAESEEAIEAEEEAAAQAAAELAQEQETPASQEPAQDEDAQAEEKGAQE